MTRHTASTFEVRLDDPLHSSRILEETLREPGEHEIVLEVERFGLTSNNLTYALLGNETPTQYWDVFPAEAGWGRVPAWGSARVIAGDAALASPGERFVGLIPMTDRFLFAGRRTADGRLTSAAPKRSAMPPTYRELRRVEVEAASHEAASADADVLLQPFYSFATLLTEHVIGAGAKTAVISSASSKAGLLVGRLLMERGVRALGLTAASRRAATESTGAFTVVKPYSQISELAAESATVFIDIAGNAEVSAAVAHHLADDLERIIIVGATHHDASEAGATDTRPAVDVEMFDTAEQEMKYGEDHGAAALLSLENDARDALLPWAAGWVEVEQVSGIGSLEKAWQAVQEPPESPLHGTVITPASR